MKELIRTIFTVLGVRLSGAKKRFGTENIDVLGFLFDTNTQQIRLPPEKAARIAELLQRALSPGSITFKEFEQLTGNLLDICEIIPQAKPMLHLFWEFEKQNQSVLHSTELRITISPQLAKDMQWWLMAVRVAAEGRSYHNKEWVGKTLQSSMPCSDASTKWMGGFWNRMMWQHQFTEEEKKVIRGPPDIPLAEAQSSMITNWCFRLEFQGKRARFACDNIGIVTAINKGESREDRVHKVIRTLESIAVEYNFHVGFKHFVREENKLCDCLSKCFPLQLAWQTR
jgi:hypothetical protein